MDMRMMVMMCSLTSTNTSSASGASTVHQCSFLSKFTASLVAPQIVQPGESPLTTQTMELAQHVLMLRAMCRHVALEIRSFAVQKLAADVTVHLVPIVRGCDVLVAHLLVHERLGTARECAFEEPFAVIGCGGGWVRGCGGLAIGTDHGRGCRGV